MPENSPKNKKASLDFTKELALGQRF